MSSIAEPRIRFFTGSQGQRIAYAAAGSGPPLVMPAWWVSHVERDVASERFRRFFEVLAAHDAVLVVNDEATQSTVLWIVGMETDKNNGGGI